MAEPMMAFDGILKAMSLLENWGKAIKTVLPKPVEMVTVLPSVRPRAWR